jgi:hypothetical protein
MKLTTPQADVSTAILELSERPRIFYRKERRKEGWVADPYPLLPFL